MTPAGTGRRQVNPERMTLVKKVHYALGALGLAPALGLLAAPTAANAATQSPARDSAAKTVSLNHRSAQAATANCTGTKQRSTENSQLQLTFWDTQNPDLYQACIGTIEVSKAVAQADVTVWVSNANGYFCSQTKEANSHGVVFIGCGRSFVEPLRVHASSSYHEAHRYVSYRLLRP
jgi:hypothetical protein